MLVLEWWQTADLVGVDVVLRMLLSGPFLALRTLAVLTAALNLGSSGSSSSNNSKNAC